MGCDFNIPKDSARAEALGAKAFLQRYKEELPVTDAEPAAIEGAEPKFNLMLRRLEDFPTPDGKTPREIRLNVPDLQIKSGYFVGVQSREFPFAGLVAHFVTENRGDPHPLGMSIADQVVVSDAIRADLQRPPGASL